MSVCKNNKIVDKLTLLTLNKRNQRLLDELYIQTNVDNKPM